jgi:ATP-binding cassette subfamily F protein 3
MINLNGISLQFGHQELFSNITFQINSSDKIGLTGKNGAGKSTLLKIISGEQKVDAGNLVIPDDCRIAYLPQHMVHNEKANILDEALSVNKELQNAQKEIDELSDKLANMEDYSSPEYVHIIERIEKLGLLLEVSDTGKAEEEAEKILKGLGFESDDMNKTMSEFSGGWKMRVELAKILLQKPDIFLLDEPTNHLDIESIYWLESFLKEYKGAIVLISHDRAFLDAITKRTIEIANKKAYDYKFPYTQYLEQRQLELEQQIREKKNQEDYIKHTEQLINKFRAKKNKAAFAQTLIKKLDKLDKVEVDLQEQALINVKFSNVPSSGKAVLELINYSKEFPGKKILDDVNLLVARGEKIAIVGKNGAGKTTLLKSIVDENEYSGEIKLGHNVKVGYFAQDQADKLDTEITVFDTVDEVAEGDIRKDLRNILGAFLFSGEDIDKKVKVLSGGEKTRLALCQLLLKPVNFLILDEPTNHLDIPSKEVLKQALANYEGTFMIVSHDRDFLNGLSNRLFEIRNKGIGIHHMGINELLKEREAELNANLANSETSIQKEKVQNPKQNKVSQKEIREWETKRKNAERHISKYEKRIAELDGIILDLDYSDKEKTDKILGEYENAKKRLEELMEEWTEAEMMLEELKIE